MDINMIEYYHDSGLMPDWAYYQQNGKTAQQNYAEQTKRIKDNILEREKLEEYKKQLEEQMLEALMISLEQVNSLEDVVAQDLNNKIHAVFEGGTIHPERLTSNSFSVQLGAALGRALGQAPFKLLDEIFNDKDKRR